jgi:predicted metalloendopeptidase
MTNLSLWSSTALAGVLALGLSACDPRDASEDTASETASEASSNQDMAAEETAVAANDEPELGTFGIETEDMDTTVDPGDDYFAYVNGAWLDSFEIPAERSSFNSFTRLFERSEDQIQAIIMDTAEADADDGSLERKIGDYYEAFMATDAIEAAGLAPVEEEMAAYDAIETTDDAALAMFDPARGPENPFALYVGVDAKEPTQYALYLTQSGLGMPNRDYYLDEKFAAKVDPYKAFLAEMAGFLGIEDPEQTAEDVYAFEKAIAEVHWEPAKRRNRDLTYNPTTMAELNEEVPGLPWDAIAEQQGVTGDAKVIMREPDALAGSAEIFANTDVETLRSYLKIHALRSYASRLPQEIDQAVFDFYSTELSGVPEQRERWKRGVSAVSSGMGEAVGQIYVERHFPAESKAQMEELVANLREAFAERLANLDWMSDATKAEAKRKLDAFTPKIGYPDEWRDYSELAVTADNPVENLRATRVFNHDYEFSKLGGPINEAEWGMTPQTVNAYYSPTRNEIVFPAAILQPPFFDPNADPAVNYGGIGAVIGHEIGHGFDDQGRKSDGTGTLRDWWTEEDAARFDEKTKALGEQYATYEPVEGFFINPELTMGENIGDLGGLAMAYSAYKLSLNGEEAPVIDGFTGDQRFFMAWAQVWKALYREEALKAQVASDPHSNAKFRVNGVVRNLDEWYEAYEVSEDDDLYLPPEERVSIW